MAKRNIKGSRWPRRDGYLHSRDGFGASTQLCDTIEVSYYLLPGTPITDDKVGDFSLAPTCSIYGQLLEESSYNPTGSRSNIPHPHKSEPLRNPGAARTRRLNVCSKSVGVESPPCNLIRLAWRRWPAHVTGPHGSLRSAGICCLHAFGICRKNKKLTILFECSHWKRHS
ncbi:hypothetical protein RRG08_049452 [Elysia crispata]|uniref:Uncharacterized protein n=1 Tax=Elysia crispata TaxID=231223 RepID=A0AAE0ZT21_9GAST|nr:hypothetical protein RRG08_049452 [Elysia crispata]